MQAIKNRRLFLRFSKINSHLPAFIYQTRVLDSPTINSAIIRWLVDIDFILPLSFVGFLFVGLFYFVFILGHYSPGGVMRRVLEPVQAACG